MPDAKDKRIFVICPIGAEGSPERTASDQLLRFVIEPVATQLGYTVDRADKIMEVGNITSQIIERLVELPIVVADMTGHNPNVFYELAVRHAANKPVVHMIALGETIPFDVTTDRAIYYRLDLEGADVARAALKGAIDSITNSTQEPESPVVRAIERFRIQQSGSPAQKGNSEILSRLEDIALRIGRVERNQSVSGSKNADKAARPELQLLARLENSSVMDALEGVDLISQYFMRELTPFDDGRKKVGEHLRQILLGIEKILGAAEADHLEIDLRRKIITGMRSIDDLMSGRPNPSGPA